MPSFAEALTPADLANLRAWLRAGGTLVLFGGAATRREDDEPECFLPALGTARASIAQDTKETNFHEWHGSNWQPFASIATLDTLRWKDAALPVLARRERLTAPDAEVLARFANDEPAVITFALGQGRVCRIGCALAPALVKTAAPAFNESLFQRRYSPDVLALYTAPLERCGLTPQIETRQGVERTLFLAEKNAALLLADYTSPAVEKDTIRIRTDRAFSKAKTWDGENIALHREGDFLILDDVPLATIQAVLLE